MQNYPNQYPNQAPPNYSGQYPNPSSSTDYLQQPPPNYQQSPNQQQYGQQLPQQPMYQPPKKKTPKLLIFAITGFVVVGLLLCGIIGVAASRTSGSNTGTLTSGTTPGATAQATAPTTSQQHFKVGDTVTVGSWKVVVNSFAVKTGSAYETPQKDAFVAVNISLTNTSSQEQNLSSLLSFKFKGADGTEYTETFVSTASPSPNGKVESGGTSKGDLVYDVPSDQKTFTLAFSPEVFSGGQTIWDLSL